MTNTKSPKGGLLSPGLLVVCLAGGCSGDEEGVQPQPSSTRMATPGSCYGAATRCEAPTKSAWEPGAAVQCEFVDRGAAAVSWTVDLVEIAGLDASSSLLLADFVVGENGGLWVAADLFRNDVNVDKAVVVHLDAAGGALAVSARDVQPSPLDGLQPVVGGLGLDRRGHFLLPRPGRGVPAVDLWAFAPQGGEPSVRRLAEGLVEAQLRVGSDGSVGLLYRHADLSGRAPDEPRPPGEPNLAVFDEAGALKQNQTLFADLLSEGRRDRVQWAAWPIGKGPMVWSIFTITGGNQEISSLLTQLDADGNPSWQRELGEPFVSSAPLSDGGIFVLLGDFTGSGAVSLERLDSDGKGIWRLPLPEELRGTRLLGVDAGERALIALDTADGRTRIYTISADASACESFTLDTCLSAPSGESICGSMLIGRGRANAVYFFAPSGVLGRATLPVSP